MLLEKRLRRGAEPRQGPVARAAGMELALAIAQKDLEHQEAGARTSGTWAVQCGGAFVLVLRKQLSSGDGCAPQTSVHPDPTTPSTPPDSSVTLPAPPFCSAGSCQLLSHLCPTPRWMLTTSFPAGWPPTSRSTAPGPSGQRSMPSSPSSSQSSPPSSSTRSPLRPPRR